MSEITLTETQHETLEAVRADLEAAYIDTYGHIRTADVIQYLLDTYTPPEQHTSDVAHERIATAEYPLLQQVATEVDGVPGSGIETETMRGELLSTLGTEEFASRLAAVDESNTGADDGPDDTSEAAESTVEPSDTAEGDADGESATTDDEASAPDTDSSGSTGGNSVLAAANKLLTDNEDKWREGGGDEPYEVDLPDGTTEAARTKDDVKQLLFKHY